MRWIEVIHLRSNIDIIDDIVANRYLDIDQPDINEGIVEVKVFRNHEKPTDLNVHLLRQADQPKHLESILGQAIARGLQGRGEVSYSIWVENSEGEKKHD